MTLCPIALAVTCNRCPAFKICPATRILGDQKTVSSANLMRSSALTQSLKKAVKKGAKSPDGQVAAAKPKAVVIPVAKIPAKNASAATPKFTRKKSK